MHSVSYYIKLPESPPRNVRDFRLILSHPHMDEVLFQSRNGRVELPATTDSFWVSRDDAVLVRVCVDRRSEIGIEYSWWCGTTMMTRGDLDAPGKSLEVLSVNDSGDVAVTGILCLDGEPADCTPILREYPQPECEIDPRHLKGRVRGVVHTLSPSDQVLQSSVQLTTSWCTGGIVPVSVLQTTVSHSIFRDPECSRAFWDEMTKSALHRCRLTKDEFMALPISSPVASEVLRHTIGQYMWSIPYALDRSIPVEYRNKGISSDGTVSVDQFWNVLNATPPGLVAGDCEDFTRTGIDLFNDLIRCPDDSSVTSFVASIARQYQAVAIDVRASSRIRLHSDDDGGDHVLHQTFALIPRSVFSGMTIPRTSKRYPPQVGIIFIDGVVWSSSLYGTNAVDSYAWSRVTHSAQEELSMTSNRVCVSDDVLIDSFYQHVIAVYLPQPNGSSTPRTLLPLCDVGEGQSTYGLDIRDFINRVNQNTIEFAGVDDAYDGEKNQCIASYVAPAPKIQGVSRITAMGRVEGSAYVRFSFNLHSMTAEQAAARRELMISHAGSNGIVMDPVGELFMIGDTLQVWITSIVIGH